MPLLIPRLSDANATTNPKSRSKTDNQAFASFTRVSSNRQARPTDPEFPAVPLVVIVPVVIRVVVVVVVANGDRSSRCQDFDRGLRVFFSGFAGQAQDTASPE